MLYLAFDRLRLRMQGKKLDVFTMERSPFRARYNDGSEAPTSDDFLPPNAQNLSRRHALHPDGCLVGPKYQRPVATTETLPSAYKESPTQFKGGQGWKVASPRDAMLRGPWWRIFKDPELNALEEQVNINNQNIKESFQNFMEARALVGEARAQLYPTLTANASYTRSGVGSAIPVTAILSTLNVSSEPDLWGKVRNAVRSAQYSAQLSAADLENERLTEQADLATFFFEIRGQDALIKLFNDTIVADQKALDYNRAQYDTGITDQISVVEAENTLQNAQASATNLGVARAQFEHGSPFSLAESLPTFLFRSRF